MCYYEKAMKELLKSSTKAYLIAMGLIAICLSVINKSYGLGYLLGILTSLFNLQLLINQIDQMLFEKKFNAWIGIPLYMLKSILFVVPMVLAIIWPDWLNLFAVVAGLLSPKFIFYINELFIKKEQHD